jgi:hypothetical protein
MIDQGVLRGFSRLCRDWFFILAFASIGLSSNFREMAHHFKGGKPVILYVCGQSLNLLLTCDGLCHVFHGFPGSYREPDELKTGSGMNNANKHFG